MVPGRKYDIRSLTIENEIFSKSSGHGMHIKDHGRPCDKSESSWFSLGRGSWGGINWPKWQLWNCPLAWVSGNVWKQSLCFLLKLGTKLHWKKERVPVEKRRERTRTSKEVSVAAPKLNYRARQKSSPRWSSSTKQYHQSQHREEGQTLLRLDR